MLIGFKVGNFLSFNEETVFSMVATKGSRHNDHVMYKDNDKFPRLVKGSFFYGANASGKSNFVKALSFAKNFITKEPIKGKSINRIPFLLCKECKEKPSTFEFEFIVGDKIYNYRFEINDERVEYEVLKEMTPSPDVIFERKPTIYGEKGISIPKGTEKVKLNADTINDNCLILAGFLNRDIEEYNDVTNWFRSKIKIVTPQTKSFLIDLIEESKISKDNIMSILSFYDLGIKDIEALEPEIFENEFMLGFLEFMKNEDNDNNNFKIGDPYTSIDVNEKSGEYIVKQLKSVHNDSVGDDVHFDINMESDGTKRILDYIPMLYDMAISDKTVIFDEIGRSLHPHLLYRFIETYYEFTKGKNCQLIATTHQDNLIDLDLLRQDEIWFVEKDNFGQSEIFPLSSFKLRNDKDVRTSYNSGRLGAVPALTQYYNLDEVKDD